jgi:RNA-binding protein
MLTSKQQAYLRGLANTMEPVLIVGKDQITDATLQALGDVLAARELVKVKILPSTELDTREAALELAHRADAELVQVIGNRAVLYRKAEKPKITLP